MRDNRLLNILPQEAWQLETVRPLSDVRLSDVRLSESVKSVNQLLRTDIVLTGAICVLQVRLSKLSITQNIQTHNWYFKVLLNTEIVYCLLYHLL